MNTFLKSKIRFYQIICMIGLLFIHNYNYSPYTITPSTLIEGKASLEVFIELFVSNSLLRFRMPLLMAISGYLMANSKELPYAQLLIKKFKTLIIPYFFISITGLVLTCIFEILVYGFHSNDGLLGKSLWHYGVKDILNFLFINPVSFQLWYLKIIFLLAAFSPIIRSVLKRVPIQALSVMFLVWMFTNHLDGEIRDRGFIFYIFGFYLKMYNIDLSKPISSFKPIYALHLFIALCFIRTGLSFYHGGNIGYIKYLLTMLFKVNEILGLYACWFCFDGFVAMMINKKWYTQISTCSFFVYAFHAPLINYIGDFLMAKHFYTFTASHLVSYVFVPSLLLPSLVLLDKIVHQHFPKFYLLFSGGRGEIDKRSLVTIRKEGIYYYAVDYVYDTLVSTLEFIIRKPVSLFSGCYLYFVRLEEINIKYWVGIRKEAHQLSIA